MRAQRRNDTGGHGRFIVVENTARAPEQIADGIAPPRRISETTRRFAIVDLRRFAQSVFRTASGKVSWPQDCAAATQTLMLQAAELGYGTCWCGVFTPTTSAAP